MRFFLKYIEIILTAAGIFVVAFVPSLFSDEEHLWLSRAVTALLVGILHGLIFFLIRHRQRQVREQTLNEIRAMLKDVLNNHLTVISISTSNNTAASKAVERIQRATFAITDALNNISEESLSSWKKKYEDSLSDLKSYQQS